MLGLNYLLSLLRGRYLDKQILTRCCYDFALNVCAVHTKDAHIHVFMFLKDVCHFSFFIISVFILVEGRTVGVGIFDGVKVTRFYCSPY